MRQICCLTTLNLVVLLMSCSAFNTSQSHSADRSPNDSLSRSFYGSTPRTANDESGELFEDEEPLALPPGLGPNSRKKDHYTHLTPGSLKVFDWPVDESRLSRGYFLKDPRGRKKRPHLGIDLANFRGTPIYSAHDGKVIYVGSSFRGYGRMIMIEGGNGDYATLYAHLSKARVKQGMWVKQGDQIGDMGNTGRSTGTHLHFEIRTLQGAVDPIAYLPPVSGIRPSNIFGKAFTKPNEDSISAEAL